MTARVSLFPAGTAACLSYFVAFDKAVSSACRRPSHFLSRAREKVTKERGTPMARPPGILPSGCAGGLRGFPTAPPCAGGKLARIPAGHPADFPPPARRAIGAPGKAARSRRAEATTKARTEAIAKRSTAISQRFAFAVAVASGAHDARLLFRAPSAAVSRGRSGRAAGEAKDGLAFSRGQESARKARPRLTHLPGMDARQAPPRGVVFSWLLLFWTSKREVARAPTGARNRSETHACATEKTNPAPTIEYEENGACTQPAPNVAHTSPGAQR